MNMSFSRSLLLTRGTIQPKDSSSENYRSGPETEENVEAEDMTSQPASNGRSLHRCPRKLMLNTDPVTDPEVVKKLDAALR